MDFSKKNELLAKESLPKRMNSCYLILLNESTASAGISIPLASLKQYVSDHFFSSEKEEAILSCSSLKFERCLNLGIKFFWKIVESHLNKFPLTTLLSKYWESYLWNNHIQQLQFRNWLSPSVICWKPRECVLFSYNKSFSITDWLEAVYRHTWA